MRNYRKKLFVFVWVFALLFSVVWEIASRMGEMADIADEDVLREAPKIALTFDDGPHAVYTEELLNGLKERGVVATFFLLGCNIEGKEELVRRMQEEGHLIGNHTYSHVQLTKLDETAACDEIWKTNMKIFDITGHIPEYIRPPFGSWNEKMACGIDMTAVLWDIDPLDWKSKNTDKVTSYICNNASEGDIILLHDVYKTSVEAALKVVDYFLSEGYEFVTVEELILD